MTGAQPGPPARSPLVATKLRPPAAAAVGNVERPRLSARLDATLNDATRLTLVSAPPGYGKSAALAGWARERRVPVAWLSLDVSDDDLARFVRYLAAALATERPTASRVAEALVPDARPSSELLAALLLEAIELDDRPFALVLDDYQAIAAPAVHELVRILIERAPPFFHPVIATREDPPIPLARLRAHRRLVEIRADDLRFELDDAAAFLAATGIVLGRPVLERLVARTEGWAAGLQLAASALGGPRDPDAAVAALAGSRRFVFDYLADEALAGLPGDLRDFLVRTSVVDRFTVDLCAELSGRTDAPELLERAERRNLFIVRLDDEGRWFRYHHLFADYLRSFLAPADRPDLEARAARWFEASGLPDEAIDHALRAGLAGEARRIVGASARSALEAGEIATVDRWLSAVSADGGADGAEPADADLSSLRAWALFYGGRLGEAVRLAEESAAPEDGGAADGRLLILRALVGTTTDSAAEGLGRRGLALVGPDPLFRALGLQAVGLARLARGDAGGAVGPLRDAYVEARRAGTPLAVLSAVNPLTHGLQMTGRRDEAEALSREVLAEFPGPAGRPLPIAWSARLSLGIARYEADDPVEARNELEAGLRSAEALGVGRPVLGWALPYLALSRAATGAPDEALAGLRPSAADTAATGMALPSLAGETEARLRLGAGDIAAAARWTDAPAAEAPADSPILSVLDLSAQLTVARVRLAQGRTGEAGAILSALRPAFAAMPDVPELVSVDILEARATLERHGREPAVAILEEAVRLAAPGGYVRRFVDDGVALARLLPAVRPVAPAFVDRLVDALSGSHRPPSTRSARSPLVEPLTARELDVLRLMGTGASNARIAAELFVSLGTAKWHVAHILGKLDASSRTEAIVRAQALGLV